MTAQQSLEISLWYNLPTIIKNTIIEESERGQFKCVIPHESLRNIDTFEARRILRYLGYNVQLLEDLYIDWKLDYGNGF